MLVVAAVEAVGDLAGGLVVALDVRVQQQQRDPAHLGLPHGDRDVTAAREGDADGELGAVLLEDGLDGEVGGVVEAVLLLLPAAAVQGLGEVAPLVEQADRGQRHAEVRGGLQVVAGEDAQAAGVDRERRGDPELHREVRDRGARSGAQRAGHGALEPAPGVEIGAQVPDLGAHPGQEGLVARRLGQTAGGHHGQHREGVLAAVHEGLRVQGAEQVEGLAAPGPAQVQREIAQGDEGLRELGGDRERAERLHGPKVPEQHPVLAALLRVARGSTPGSFRTITSTVGTRAVHRHRGRPTRSTHRARSFMSVARPASACSTSHGTTPTLACTWCPRADDEGRSPLG